LGLLLGGSLMLAPRLAFAVSDDEPHADTRAASLSKPVATLLWGAAQLIPTPLVATDGHIAQGGLRWQITPLLYSFGIAAKPWRSFVVAPMARLSGSLELFVAPEWTCCAGGARDGWLVRGGLRGYLPLLEHGETLALSLGASYHRNARVGGPSFDLGLHTLFGMLGLVATVSPGLEGRQLSLALSIRYF
jgi:hypothetical protein